MRLFKSLKNPKKTDAKLPKKSSGLNNRAAIGIDIEKKQMPSSLKNLRDSITARQSASISTSIPSKWSNCQDVV